MRLNYTQLSKPKSVAKPFEAKLEGHAFTVTLQRLSGDVQEVVADEVSKLTQRYVHGGWFGDDGEFRKDPDVFVGDHGEPVAMSRSLITMACTLGRAQCQAEADRYSFANLVTLSAVNDDLWAWLKGCYNSLFLPQEADEQGEDKAR